MHGERLRSDGARLPAADVVGPEHGSGSSGTKARSLARASPCGYA
jgi:hypothetical protein